ncbi:MAG: type II secretion system protein [Campylobacter sp.]|uniref:type II secretion system protein n=1 Tax=Campylobacter sp. TaxID=205 RepID=UPI002A7EFD9C|nr:type II secretion system protein [Campylobacter sp.]MDY5115059.1 type II secretion system protein [Campylobacter sp.]
MKKGFTMIELIFVIVILGILASVAIPRLAATREDAEISAAVANLRTLVSDATAYYAVKGSFAGVKWKDLTNVPLKRLPGKGGGPMDNSTEVSTEALLGDKECIGVKFVDKTDDAPAHIKFTSKPTTHAACGQVVAAAPVKAYIDSIVDGVKDAAAGKGAIAIGSSTSIY